MSTKVKNYILHTKIICQHTPDHKISFRFHNTQSYMTFCITNNSLQLFFQKYTHLKLSHNTYTHTKNVIQKTVSYKFDQNKNLHHFKNDQK